MEFIKDQWYESITDNQKPYYFKFDNKEVMRDYNRIWFSISIDPGDKNLIGERDYIANTDMERNAFPISQDFIDTLLPGYQGLYKIY